MRQNLRRVDRISQLRQYGRRDIFNLKVIYIHYRLCIGLGDTHPGVGSTFIHLIMLCVKTEPLKMEGLSAERLMPF